MLPGLSLNYISRTETALTIRLILIVRVELFSLLCSQVWTKQPLHCHNDNYFLGTACSLLCFQVWQKQHTYCQNDTDCSGDKLFTLSFWTLTETTLKIRMIWPTDIYCNKLFALSFSALTETMLTVFEWCWLFLWIFILLFPALAKTTLKVRDW